MSDDAPKGPPLRIAICIPTRNEVDYEFAQCLADLSATLGATLVAEGVADFATFFFNGSMIDESRQVLTRLAAQWNATHILWLDTDMTFPPSIVHRFLKRNVDFVAANYVTRRPPYKPVSYKRTDEERPRCFTREDSTGLEEVAATGFGCVLMRTRMLAKLPPPLFDTKRRADGATLSEDVAFCEAARAAGFQLWIDHDVSKEIGHAGRMVFRHVHVEAIEDFKQEESRLIVTPEEAAHGV